MSASAGKSAPKRRTASKQERRVQLIKATIRSIAKRGLSDTTMATVTREAGLSLGIINLHFKSKERLLVETLHYVADEFTAAWKKVLDNSGPSNAEKLRAIVDVDFTPPVCEPNKLAVWFAFWGESKSRPTYRKICANLDKQYDQMLVELCAQIIDEGPYPGVDADTVATGLSAMSEGLWLDMLVSPESMNAEKAKNVCLAYLASVLPKHFGE
jgi:TetR/AcrR family transcriptional repressor of bet genes